MKPSLVSDHHSLTTTQLSHVPPTALTLTFPTTLVIVALTCKCGGTAPVLSDTPKTKVIINCTILLVLRLAL